MRLFLHMGVKIICISGDTILPWICETWSDVQMIKSQPYFYPSMHELRMWGGGGVITQGLTPMEYVGNVLEAAELSHRG
jgi:hypothetical protein